MEKYIQFSNCKYQLIMFIFKAIFTSADVSSYTEPSLNPQTSPSTEVHTAGGRLCCV